jgi:hypothetical protein
MLVISIIMPFFCVYMAVSGSSVFNVFRCFSKNWLSGASFESYRLIGAVSNYHQSFLVEGGEVVVIPRTAICSMRSSVLIVRNTR